MNQINWKQKLSSRKFWSMLAGVTTTVLGAVGVVQSDIVRVTAIIAGVGVIAVYILAETKVDTARLATETSPEEPPASR